MKHMEGSSFDLKVMEDGEIIIKLKPNPGICCMQCVGKFLMKFCTKLMTEGIDGDTETELH